MSEDVAKKEQFMLLAKHAKGLALVDLITKATAEPGLFTFGELLSLPGVQEVRSRKPPLMGGVGGSPPAFPAPAAARRATQCRVRAATPVRVWNLAAVYR